MMVWALGLLITAIMKVGCFRAGADLGFKDQGFTVYGFGLRPKFY